MDIRHKLCVVVVFIDFFTCGLSQTYDVIKDRLPERPHFGGVMGKYLNYPGLVYEPNVPSFEGLIHFTKGLESTYKPYISHLESRLAPYENAKQTLEKFIDCANLREYRPTKYWDKICRFDLIYLGDTCNKWQHFGYDDGAPCITLSLERVVNWLPEPYTNDTVPEKIRDYYYEYAVTVHCEGEYFPNIGQDGWISPVVFVYLSRPTPAMALRVTCTAYARNMKHDDMLHTGKVSFDVMVD